MIPKEIRQALAKSNAYLEKAAIAYAKGDGEAADRYIDKAFAASATANALRVKVAATS